MSLVKLVNFWTLNILICQMGVKIKITYQVAARWTRYLMYTMAHTSSKCSKKNKCSYYYRYLVSEIFSLHDFGCTTPLFNVSHLLAAVCDPFNRRSGFSFYDIVQTSSSPWEGRMYVFKLTLSCKWLLLACFYVWNLVVMVVVVVWFPEYLPLKVSGEGKEGQRADNLMSLSKDINL